MPAKATMSLDLPLPSPADPYLADVIQIDSGRRASCALNVFGELYCWGEVRGFDEKHRVPFFGEPAKTPVGVGGLEGLGPVRLVEFMLRSNSLVGLGDDGRMLLAGAAAAFAREKDAQRHASQPWRELNLAEAAPRWAENDASAVTLSWANSINSRVFFPAGIRDVGRLVGISSRLCWVDVEDHLLCDSGYGPGDTRRPLSGVFLDRDSSACIATIDAMQCDMSGDDLLLDTLDGGSSSDGKGNIYTQRIELDAPPVDLNSRWDAGMACALTESGGFTCGFRQERRDPAYPAYGVRVSKQGDFIDLAIRRGLICTAQRTGPVKCFLSVNDRFVPPPDFKQDLEYEIEGTEGVVEVALGKRHGCGRHRDGHVLCWGDDNRAGQLGCGDCGPSKRKARRVVAPAEQSTAPRKGPRLKPRPSGGWVNSKVPPDQIPPVVWWYDAVKVKP